MRPNYVLTATNSDGRLILHGLYYNGSKAKRAFEHLQKPSEDGSYTILFEDGRFQSVIGYSNLIVKLCFLGDHIWTSRNRWKKSFFDTTEEEYEEISSDHDIPVELLKEIASYELSFIEDKGETRWNARKRLYLPRKLYGWF